MRAAAFGVLLVAVGCGGGASAPDATVAVLLPDAHVVPDSGAPDASLDDGNDSFAQAATLTLGDPEGAAGVLQAPLDHDFYRLEIAAPGWIEVRTVANVAYLLTGVDTAIGLYAGPDNRVALANAPVFDSGQRRDSQLYYYVDAPGTYYVEVLEFSEIEFSAGALPAPEGHPDFYYRVVAEPLPARPAIVIDPEAGDDAASAAPAPFEADGVTLVGRLEDASDVDVYAIDLPWTEASIMGEDPGLEDLIGPVVWLTDPAASAVIASVDTSRRALRPWVNAPGPYLLWIARSTGAPSGPHRYAVDVRRSNFDPYPLEAEDAAAPGSNDTIETAERVTLVPTQQPSRRRGPVLSRLSVDADADVFVVAVTAGQFLSPMCMSRMDGSGVLGLSVELIDPAGAVVGTGVEGETTAYVSHTALVTGDYAIRLTKTAQDPAVHGDFVRCDFSVTTPS